MFSVSVSQWTNKDREKTGLSIRAAQLIKNIIEIAVNLCQAELCSWRPTSSKKNIVMKKQHFLANIATSDREYVWLKYCKCHWQRSRSRNIWRHRTEWVKSWKLQRQALRRSIRRPKQPIKVISISASDKGRLTPKVQDTLHRRRHGCSLTTRPLKVCLFCWFDFPSSWRGGDDDWIWHILAKCFFNIDKV